MAPKKRNDKSARVYAETKALTRARQAEEDDAVFGDRVCPNCWENMTDAGSGWVRWRLVGDPDSPETEEQSFCAKCIKIDELRSHKGDPPPSMESIRKRPK
jgi:hypothetical protein